MSNEDRPITPLEMAVMRAAFDRAPLLPIPAGILDALATLRVVSRCDCGCDSVDFATPVTDERPKRLADGVGTTPAGGKVGLMIWSRGPHITSLEVYDLGAGDNDLRLPALESIVPWERTSAR